jgi:hypothetical protein
MKAPAVVPANTTARIGRWQGETDTGLERGPHKAQALQGNSIEYAMPARSTRYRSQQPAQQLVADNMQTHARLLCQTGN